MQKILNKQTAKVGERYACPWGHLQITRIYRLTEEEANENSLLYLDRFEAVDNYGKTHGGALPGSDTSDPSKWAIYAD